MGRYFAGISLPPEIRTKLVRVTESLKPSIPARRWYTGDQLHITTNFLGELDQAALDNVIQVLIDTAPKHKSFRLSLHEIGAFANARVLWCGVGGETDQLNDLQLDLRKQFQPFSAERYQRDQYIPHITLARTGRPEQLSAQLQEKRAAVETIIHGTPWIVTSVCLFESVLDADGANYPLVHEVQLHNNN